MQERKDTEENPPGGCPEFRIKGKAVRIGVSAPETEKSWPVAFPQGLRPHAQFSINKSNALFIVTFRLNPHEVPIHVVIALKGQVTIARGEMK